MIYTLLHKLFGWDYVQWDNGFSGRIYRVHIDGMGRPFYWQYKSIYTVQVIHTPEEVVWLTCKPEKYLTSGGD